MASYGASPAMQKVNTLRGWEDIQDVSRHAIKSSHGRHRPYTRGGGYNKESHNKQIQENREGPQKKERIEIKGGGFIEKIVLPPPPSRIPTATRNMLLPYLPGEGPGIKSTLNSRVSTDWPYHRGTTPPPLDPQPQYDPIDTRDENGNMHGDGLHPGARMYHSVNGGRGENGAGAAFLNGLPLSNFDGRYTTVRVAGKGVMDGDEAARMAAAKRKALKDQLTPNSSGNINPRINLQGGGLNGRPMEMVPVELYMNPELKITDIDISENLFRFLPEGMCNMASVTRLDVSACRLQRLPGMIHRMKSLVFLMASRNHMDRLPVLLPQLPRLRHLDLSNNRFMTVPDFMSALTGLEILSLTGNQLKTEYKTLAGDDLACHQLPSFAGMTSLQKLSLDNNLLTVVPEGIHLLPCLTFLNLSYNKIASRGDGFTTNPVLDAYKRLTTLSRMTKVETLLMTSNCLDELPAVLCALFTLTELRLGHNRLNELPPEVIHLSRLRLLNIDHNPVKGLPTELAHMPWLSHMSSRSLPVKRLQGINVGGVSGRWSRDMGKQKERVMSILKDYIEQDLEETYDAVLPPPPPISKTIYGRNDPERHDEVLAMAAQRRPAVVHGRRGVGAEQPSTPDSSCTGRSSSLSSVASGVQRQGRRAEQIMSPFHGLREGDDGAYGPSPTPLDSLQEGAEVWGEAQRHQEGRRRPPPLRQTGSSGKGDALSQPARASLAGDAFRPGSRGGDAARTGSRKGSFRLASRGEPRPRSQGGDGILRPPSRARTPGEGRSVSFVTEDFPLGGRVLQVMAPPRPRAFKIHHGSSVTPYVPVSALQDL